VSASKALFDFFADLLAIKIGKVVLINALILARNPIPEKIKTNGSNLHLSYTFAIILYIHSPYWTQLCN
jgi:hypothetical protein